MTDGGRRAGDHKPAPGEHRHLSDAERACLLRAARERLKQLTDELQRLLALSAPDRSIISAREEIQCVASAIRWLWRDGAKPGETIKL